MKHNDITIYIVNFILGFILMHYFVMPLEKFKHKVIIFILGLLLILCFDFIFEFGIIL